MNWHGANGALRDRSGNPQSRQLARVSALTYHNLPVELRISLVNTAAHEYFSDLGKN